MAIRVGRAALWIAAGFVLGAAALVGGQGEEGLREKLIEIERLSARLRALDGATADAPAADEEGGEWECVHVGDITAGVDDFSRPRRIPRDAEVMHTGPLRESPQPYGTIEEILWMVRSRVRPEAWEEGSQIMPLGMSLLLHARPDVNRDVRAYVDGELRPAARRTVDLMMEIVEAEGALAAALAGATGGDLETAQRDGLDEALAAGAARRLFHGRLRALSRQQAFLWHGAEAATVADADVRVATRAESADPVVDVERLGTLVEARCTATEGTGRVRVQISLEHAIAEDPVRTAEAGKAGTLQMPARATIQVDADLWTGDGRWSVAAERTDAGQRRFLLVRPTVIGGAR